MTDNDLFKKIFVKNMRTFAGNFMANGTAAVQYGGATPQMFPDVFSEAAKRLRRSHFAHDPVYKLCPNFTCGVRP